ncbi:MAG: hypothetical protein P8020_22025 [Acidobacteriota bacterium]
MAESDFEAVRIDPEVHTLAWPNGADFDPAALHDWFDYEEAFRQRAKHWGAVHRSPDSLG